MLTAAVMIVSCGDEGEATGGGVFEYCWEECEEVSSGLRMAAKSTADEGRCIGSRD